VAALASNRLSAEALHMFKQIFAVGLQSNMVASLDEGVSTSLSSAKAARLGKSFETGLESLAKADVVLAAGVDLAEDHQVAGFLVKRNLSEGTKLILVDAPGNALSVMAELNLTLSKGSEIDLVKSLATEAAALKAEKPTAASGLAEEKFRQAEEKIRQAAQLLASASAPVIVYGSALPGKNPAAVLDALVELATVTQASLVSFKGQANSVAAAQYGLEKSFALNGHNAVFMALGDDTPSQRLMQKLEKTPFFVVAASYTSAATARADVVLPVETWSELSGHFVNLEGRVQTAQAAIGMPEGVKSTVEALAAVASSLNIHTQEDWQTGLTERIPAAPIRMN
jgi:NADH dehydrogenase/NADH:ubiquinone oxidoreductase subunit G